MLLKKFLCLITPTLLENKCCLQICHVMQWANQKYRLCLAPSQKQFFLGNWMHLSNLIVKYLAFAC